MTTFDVIWSVSVLLLKGQTLHVAGVTATEGVVVGPDRKIKHSPSAFDAALAFVELVGVKNALKSARVRACLPRKGVVQWI